MGLVPATSPALQQVAGTSRIVWTGNYSLRLVAGTSRIIERYWKSLTHFVNPSYPDIRGNTKAGNSIQQARSFLLLKACACLSKQKYQTILLFSDSTVY